VRATGSTTPRHALGQRNIRQGWRQPRPPRQTDNQPTRCRFRRSRAVGLEERSQADIRYETREVIAELQLARTSAVVALAGGAFLLAGVCGYFLRNPIYAPDMPPSDGLRQVAAAVGALLVAAPAAITAFLTTSLSDLGSYLTRGVRFLCAAGAGAAVVAGFSLAVLLPKDHGLYHAALLTASATNMFAALTVGATLFPRSRANGRITRRRIARSQKKLVDKGLDPTSVAPDPVRGSGVPADARYRQRRHAFVGALGSLLFLDWFVAAMRTPRTVNLLFKKNWPTTFRRIWYRTATHRAGAWSLRELGSLIPGRHADAVGRLLVALGCLALLVVGVLEGLQKVGRVARGQLAHEDPGVR
jgi:hypothetical protein